MGFFDSVLHGLTWLICGPRAPQPPPSPTEDIYVPPSVPHRIDQRPQQPPSSPPSYQYPQQNGHVISRPQERPPHQGPRVDQNQVNQSNAHYVSLRSRAKEAGDEMHKLSVESQEAFRSGDKGLAKELSNKSKELRVEMERLNRQASEWIFVENNKDSGPNEIDLHGLMVKEAIEYTERAIQEARERGDKEVHLIVGKGLHSANGQAKIKPAVEELMEKYQLVAELDPRNAGVLIVSLDGRDKGGQVVRPDEIARGIENRDDDRCIIM